MVKDDDGSTWLFVEEFHRWHGIGRIVAMELRGHAIVRTVSVLEGPHHRAFPRVWRQDDGWLATVDGCETPGRIYSFNSLGDVWRAVPDVVLPAPLTDPTICVHDSVAQLVGTNWTSDESSDVEVWSNEGPDFRNWEARPDLGYRDSKCGRGAGNIDLARSLRAVQDGVSAYGTAVSLISWPVVDGHPRLERRFAGADLGFTGTHTLAWTPDGQTVVLDAWRRRLDPLGWLWKLTDLRHLKKCRAETLAALASPPE